MKKQYISPELTIHQISAEAMLLEASKQRMIDFGNRSTDGAYIPDVEQYGIDVIEDFDDDDDFEWGTI